MNIKNLKIILDKLVEDILDYEKHHPGSITNISIVQRYKDLLSLCKQPLFENNVFIEHSYSNQDYTTILDSLKYIKLLLDLAEKEAIIEQEKKFMNPSRQMLEQAGIAFKNEDFPGVSNKLNTCVELALKDILDIPTTIKGINVSKIIDIMISEEVGPTKYLEEVKKHVLLDNLVKHQGLGIVEARAGSAISSTENLLNKLPNEPYELKVEIQDKIWSGVN
ncbi:hypothetical protein GOV12_00015 [Candidatus Pacearchaeota archaeon]|nr:hypothetical protein [Candidatus Pacearchaeota archaeon]